MMKPGSIARLLPEIYQQAYESGDGSQPLHALIHVMAAMLESTDNYLDDDARLAEPWRCEDEFLAPLARWVGLSAYIDGPGDSKGCAGVRELIRQAAVLARARGTRETLDAILKLATGLTGFEFEENPPDENGVPMSYHFRIRVPAGGARQRDLIERVIDNEKPCFTTVEILWNNDYETKNRGVRRAK
jgi:phage tail-like protein